jgi:hypothetical protein
MQPEVKDAPLQQTPTGQTSPTAETALEPDHGQPYERVATNQTGKTDKQTKNTKTSHTEIIDSSQTAVTSMRKTTAKLVIVIDDVGQTLQDLEPFLRYPATITFSILPHLPYSTESVAHIRAAGKEAILHLPMEPLGDANPGTGAVFSSQNEQEIEYALANAFASVPGVKGFNNHMGSRATADLRIMQIVLRYAYQHSKYFLDSKTTAQSVAAAVAKEYNVPFLERTLFLDNEPSAEAITAQFNKALASLAHEATRQETLRKPFIAIGHVQNPELLNVMVEMLPVFKKEGLELTRLDAGH